MAYVKLVKNNAYYKRFQTKFRRRREGKTDYYARKRLIVQPKDKYNSPKYRFVVRITSGKVICQIIYATLKGDKVVSQAQSSELKQHGLTSGLTNYSACYATGLLLGRRLLTQLKMDSLYKGADEVNGEKHDVNENPNEERRPFKAVLDTGLFRTTTGARVFGALKGATDAGIYIPHSIKRYPGFLKAGEEVETDEYHAEVHRDRIFGVHVDNYMKELKEESADAYQKQFSQWDKTLKAAKVDSVEKLMTKVFAAIRKNPGFSKKAAAKNPKRDHVTKQKQFNVKYGRTERKLRAKKKIELQRQQNQQ